MVFVCIFREVLDRLVLRAHEDWLDKKDPEENLYVFFLPLFIYIACKLFLFVCVL